MDFHWGHMSTPVGMGQCSVRFQDTACTWKESQLVSEKDIKMYFNKQNLLL